MATKLFVGGISFSTTEDTMRTEFEKAGTVASVKIIMDRETGRSKGFGFVEMSTETEAQKAVEMFNNTEFDGRNIKVDEARPMVNRR